MNRFLLITFVLFISSCTYQRVPTAVKQKFSYCISNDSSKINSNLDLNGYYEFFKYKIDEKGQFVIRDSTSTNRYLFFNDGTFMIIRHPKRNLEGTFGEMIAYANNHKKHPGYYHTDWGAYRIYGDTIKTQFMNHKTTLEENRMYLFEQWFLIIGYRKIKQIGGKYLVAFEGGKQVRDEKSGVIEEYEAIRTQMAEFVPIINLPPPNSWLKNEKWFWCNERDYINWISK